MGSAHKGHNGKEVLTSEPSPHPWKQSCFHSKPWTGSGHVSLTCGAADAPLLFFSRGRGWMFFLLCQKLLLLVSLVARLLALFLPDVLLSGKHFAISSWLVFSKSLISFAFPTSLKDYTEESPDREIVRFSVAILIVVLSTALFFKQIPLI